MNDSRLKLENSLGRKVALVFTSKLSIELLGFLALVIVAREMGAQPIGMVAYAGGIVGLFSVISSLGFRITHKKRISEGKDLGKCMGTMLFIHIALTLIWVSAFFIWIGYLKFYFNSSFGSKEQEIILYIILISTVFLKTSNIFSETLVAKGEVAKSSFSSLFSKIVVSTSKIFVSLTGLGVIFLATSQLLGYLALFLALLLFSRKFPIKRPDWSSVKDYVQFTIPLAFLASFTAISASIDKAMLGFFYNSEEVAYYTISNHLGNSFALIGYSISTVIFPIISSYSSQGKNDSVIRLVAVSERYLTLILTPLVAFIIVYSEIIIIFVFGLEFASVALLLQIFTLGVFLRAISRPYGTQLISTGNVKITATIGITAGTIHILLNFIFIPDNIFGLKMLGMGAIGAALVYLIENIIISLMNRYYAYKTLKNTLDTKIVFYILIGFIMGIFTHHLILYFDISNILLLVPLTILGCTIYFSSLAALGLFHKKDVSFLLSIVNPRKMKSYITSELKE